MTEEAKKPEETTEIQKAPETALSAERTKTKHGIKKLDKEDQMIPRIKVMQGLSPEVTEGKAKYGDLVNSLTGESYGKRVAMVPINWWGSRIYWRNREDGGGILCRSFDAVTGSTHGKCEHCKFKEWTAGEDGTQIPCACTKMFNILCAISKEGGQQEMVVVSFLKTSFKQGKQFINLMSYKNVDLFNFEYELYTDSITNDLGTFNVLKYQDHNKHSSDAVYKRCLELYSLYGDIDKIKVDEVDTPVEDKPSEVQKEFDF